MSLVPLRLAHLARRPLAVFANSIPHLLGLWDDRFALAHPRAHPEVIIELPGVAGGGDCHRRIPGWNVTEDSSAGEGQSPWPNGQRQSATTSCFLMVEYSIT
jgi:hypothetical protein